MALHASVLENWLGLDQNRVDHERLCSLQKKRKGEVVTGKGIKVAQFANVNTEQKRKRNLNSKCQGIPFFVCLSALLFATQMLLKTCIACYHLYPKFLSNYAICLCTNQRNSSLIESVHYNYCRISSLYSDSYLAMRRKKLLFAVLASPIICIVVCPLLIGVIPN